MSLNHQLEMYKLYLMKQGLSDLTITGYLSDLHIFAMWYQKVNKREMALEAITSEDIRKHRQLLVKEDYSVRTVNRRLSSLSAFIRWGLQKEIIVSSPMQNIHLRQPATSVPRWLTKQEQIALHQAIAHDLKLAKLRYPKRWLTRRRDASLVLFLLHTGLRLSEALTLQMDDIQLSERKSFVVVRNDKRAKQCRHVPLNRDARKALEDWFVVRPEHTFVWTAVEGTQKLGLSERAVQRILSRYAQDADIESLSSRVLRRTFEKNSVDAGVAPEKMALLPGDDDVNLRRIYNTPDRQGGDGVGLVNTLSGNST